MKPMLQANVMHEHHRSSKVRSTDLSEALLKPNGRLPAIFPLRIQSTNARERNECGESDLKIVYKK